VADHRDPANGSGLRRGLAVPCFADDPADLVALGIAAEQAGLDGYFLWDHLVHSDSGTGPPIVDPWQVLAVVAARTSRIKLGTMITPVARRRPWKLAKEVTTLDLLSGGRVILGVGLGDPARAEFGLFGEPTDRRVRAELLDEGLDVLAGLWTGQPFSHEGKHFTVGPVRFSPSPAQRPRVPIWVGGILPSGALLARVGRRVTGAHPPSGPVARAARWDGFVPIHPGRPGDRATVGEIAAARDRIAGLRGTTADFDIAVWGELDSAGRVAARLPGYRDAGATWWLESPGSGPGWLDAARERLQRGPELDARKVELPVLRAGQEALPLVPAEDVGRLAPVFRIANSDAPAGEVRYFHATGGTACAALEPAQPGEVGVHPPLLPSGVCGFPGRP